jgi:pseudouridine-5'-monophosphatase
MILQFLVPWVCCLSATNSHERKIMTSVQSLSNFKGILFDMDGTLLETESLGCNAVYYTLKDQMSEEARESFKERNFRMEWKLKQQTLGLPDRKWPPIVFEWAKKNWGVEDPPTVDEFVEKWDANMFEHMSGVEACKGAKELVSQLAEKLPLAIATSSRAKAVEQKRKRHEDMFQKIPTIVTGDDPAVKNGKPAPDIYLEAARRINVKPEECIVFEDGMTGVKSGKAAGCFVVAIPDSRCTPEERAEFESVADLVLADLSQFAEKIAVC